MNSTNVNTELENRQQIRASAIKRIAGYANAVTALLETYAMVPAADQGDILAVAGSMAGDVARDLAAIVGSAS